MGFIQPNLPTVDHDTWDHESLQEKMRPMARHFAEHGFGSPDVLIVGYALKIVAYVAVGWGLVMTTPGIDGALDVTSWYADPAVFYKFVLWTMLFEVLGLGCGFGPLNLRFSPPMGSFLYWLRPGTIRLAPWPRRVPLTGGDTRTVVDAALYAALLVGLVIAMWGALPRWQVAVVLGVLAVLGLRDKVIFLAARSEVYGALSVTYLLAVGDQVIAAMLVMMVIWWGAATSKINLHFPFVMQTMQSNSPVWRSTRIKHLFHRSFPDDLRPSRLVGAIAHVATVVEFGVPLVLLLSGGGWLTTAAAIAMVAFHLGIITSLPMGVPLEWNVFMMVGVLTLFVGHADLAPADLAHPLPVVALLLVVVGTVVAGNLRPDKFSFLPAMRYYAGNWGSSVWCFRGDALDRLDAGVVKASRLPHQQLEQLYGSLQEAMVPLSLGYCFRSFHPQGRALYTLVPRVCDPAHDDYLALDGELVAGTVLGWNFGDGHFHDEQLAAALQRRCHFEPGTVRVVFLESQPFHRWIQEYRLFDVATGEIERGYVRVAELAARQPTDHDVPLHVTSSSL